MVFGWYVDRIFFKSNSFFETGRMNFLRDTQTTQTASNGCLCGLLLTVKN